MFVSRVCVDGKQKDGRMFAFPKCGAGFFPMKVEDELSGTKRCHMCHMTGGPSRKLGGC